MKAGGRVESCIFRTLGWVKLHKAAHTVYKTSYRRVWGTRFRRKSLSNDVTDYLKLKLQEVGKFYPDWHLTEIGIEKDHVHVHMFIPPKYSVSFVVETLKKNTSLKLKVRYKFLAKMYRDRGGIWSKEALSPRSGLMKPSFTDM